MKAKTAETGLTQQEIATIFEKSLSTISRALKQMVHLGYCNYVYADSEQARAERKYFAKGSYVELVIARANQYFEDSFPLKRSIKKIVESIPETEAEKRSNRDLIDRIEFFTKQIDLVVATYDEMLKMVKESFKDWLDS
ncbi:MAG: hypothetical protein ACXAEU_20360 [Candidatus Hodarchaeales archaeon]